MRDDPQARARRVEVGRWLRELRQERGLTQAALARAARMGQATLSNYEKGRRDIPAVTLVSVAGALGLSIGEVLDVDHILIVRDERMREAVRVLVRSPDVLDAIVGPRPPRRRKADPGEQDGDDAGDEASEADGESTDAADEGAAAASAQDDGNGTDAEDKRAEDDGDGEQDGSDGESNGAEGESNGAGGERIGADDPGGVAPPDTGTQA